MVIDLYLSMIQVYLNFEGLLHETCVENLSNYCHKLFVYQTSGQNYQAGLAGWSKASDSYTERIWNWNHALWVVE